MKLSKALLWLSLVGSAGFAAYKYLQRKAPGYIKQNFRLQVAKVQIHKISLSSVEFRLALELINLTPIEVVISDLKANIFYVKNGSPVPFAEGAISTPIKVGKQKRTNFAIRVTMKTGDVVRNLTNIRNVVSSGNFPGKVVLSANIDGNPMNIMQDFNIPISL
jgi:LEA14-like dessication related protein